MRGVLRVGVWLECLVPFLITMSSAQEVDGPPASDYALNAVPTPPIALVGIAPL